MTLSDLLSSNLSRDAHSAIFSVLSSDGRKGLANARLASRGLRDLVDGAIAHLTVSEPQRGCTFEEVQQLSHGGRWLQRWPQCSRLSLIGRNSAVLILGASSAPCRRITELEVSLPDASDAELSDHLPDTPSSVAGALAELLRRMPELRALQLSTPAWLSDEGGVPLEGLPHLTSLSLNHLSWLGCIGPTLAPQLTRLQVTLEGVTLEGDDEGDDVPSPADLAAALEPMAALREFVLDGGEDADDACVVLDALPPTVQRCSLLGLVWWDLSGVAYYGTLSCVFSQGVLTSCSLKAGPETYSADADATLEFLEAVLLPCTKLGQRLGLLELDMPLTNRSEEPWTAPQLLQRCDAVRASTAVCNYGGTDAPQGEKRSTLGLARILGMPSKLNVWCNMSSLLDFDIFLRPPPYADAACEGLAGGGDEGGGGGAGRGGGGASSSLAGAQHDLPDPRALLERVLEAMLSGGRECSGGDGSSNGGSSSGGGGSDNGGWSGGKGYELLLRGPAISALFAAAEQQYMEQPSNGPHDWERGVHDAVAPWVKTIRERAAPGDVGSYRPLPAVQAIVLTCSSPAAVQKAAAAARHLGADAGQGAGGGEGSGGEGGEGERESGAASSVSAEPAATAFQAALSGVLQALWDGTEPGGPGPDVVGLERLLWLMEALDVIGPKGLFNWA
ncbi:hypothetical protein HYH03_006392 [Edaphochlamys debaryana]|uniref:Uncharacterized protein n=1 Tax=Edaphochlamys debaryana TaxID=47281 RepID=A0A836C050_9CHLO|nr:hypothetical protein HYH03_006392 [Edaphochlamys debaryana]|eukprot:KAG2495446.1 hypothetical protein HYH03_006392 [Edaphochlamys debaryana]